MIYGTDHPFGEPSRVAELIDSLACSPDERELIYHGNLEALMRVGDLAERATLGRG
jgi:predicted TIM-barrel fold metal-dependent hydrolase